VPVSPDPTGVLGTGFELRNQGSTSHLTLELSDGSGTTIKLTKRD